MYYRIKKADQWGMFIFYRNNLCLGIGILPIELKNILEVAVLIYCICLCGGDGRGSRMDTEEWNFVGRIICQGVIILSRKEKHKEKEGPV